MYLYKIPQIRFKYAFVDSRTASNNFLIFILPDKKNPPYAVIRLFGNQGIAAIFYFHVRRTNGSIGIPSKIQS